MLLFLLFVLADKVLQEQNRSEALAKGTEKRGQVDFGPSHGRRSTFFYKLEFIEVGALEVDCEGKTVDTLAHFKLSEGV